MPIPELRQRRSGLNIGERAFAVDGAAFDTVTGIQSILLSRVGRIDAN
jgi:hypothetical protein